MTVWHTAESAAGYVRLSERSVRDAIRRGDLAAYGIGKGREYRIDQDDIDAWIKSKAWEPAS